MKLYKTEAVVLRARTLREADQLLVLYSKQHGKIKVVAHGVSKPSSRKRGAVQPFCHSQFLLHRGRQMDSVSQCEGIEIFPHLRSDFSLLSYASYLMELVETLSAEGEPNEYVFMLLISTLYLLNPTDTEILARAFEIKLISVLGYRPHLESCVSCHGALSSREVGFSPALGGILCHNCIGPNVKILRINRGTLETLKILLTWDLSRVVRLKADKTVRGQLKNIMREFLDYHIEYRVKSARFLDILTPKY